MLNFLEQSFYLGIFLIIGRITKRAQVPFSSWLPAAISAPTPISALVHSSTLVTAGVYLLTRFYLIFNKLLLVSLITISLVTIIIRRIRGVVEADLKKVVAFSTLRQLGFIIIVISLGINFLCFFHIIIHAFFKSLIFLCRGILIHSFNTQSIKIFGNIINFSLIKNIFILVRLSIRGFLFFSGFFSKDIILDFSLSSSKNLLIYLMVFIGILLTVLYRFRLIFIAFTNYVQKPFLEFYFKNIFLPVVVLRVISLLRGSYLI